MSKLSPELKVTVFQAPHLIVPPIFSISDHAPKLVKLAAGNSGGQFDEGTVSSGDLKQWTNQPYFDSIDGVLDVIRLGSNSNAPEGAAATSSGDDGLDYFILRPRTIYLNSLVPPVMPNDPSGLAGLGQIRWRAASGTFRVYLPHVQPLRTFIMCANLKPDTVARAQTIDYLLESQEMRLDMIFEGAVFGQTQPEAIRVGLGDDKYSVVWRRNAQPVLEESVNGDWTPLCPFVNSPAFTSPYRGFETIWLRQIARRLVITHKSAAGGMRQYTVTAAQTNTLNGDPSLDALPFTWPRGRLSLQTYGIWAKLGVNYLEYSDPSTANSYSSSSIQRVGAFARTIALPGQSVNAVDKTAYASNAGPGNTTVGVTLSYSGDTVGYVCTLTPDPDCQHSPAASKIVAYEPAVQAYPAAASIDIRPGVNTAQEVTADPRVTEGANFTIDLVRSTLDSKCANWSAYVQQYNKVQISACWRNTDGSYTPWVGRVDGIITNPTPSRPGFRQENLRLEISDKTFLLRKPASYIDERYPYALMPYLNGGVTRFYGADAVEFLLGIFLGDNEKNNLNGGLGSTHFLPEGFPYIVDSSADAEGWLGLLPNGNLVTQDDFNKLLKTPYRSYGADWIKMFRDYDTCDFFYGPIYKSGGTLATAFPVPIYGLWYQYLIGRPTWQVKDKVYVTGDENLLFLGAEVHHHPERDFNEVSVYSSELDRAMQGIVSTDTSASAQLPNSDARSQAHTHRRTLDVDLPLPLYLLNSVPQAMAATLINLYAGKPLEWPSITLPRGEENMFVGDKAQFTANDSGLGLDNLTFRILQIENNWNFAAGAAKSFDTKLSVFTVNDEGF